MDYISVFSELERIGVSFHQASEAEIKLICPFHDDSAPSLYVNTEKKLCHCKSCDWKGNFVSYLAKVENKLAAEVNFDLEQRYGKQSQKSIPPQRIEDAHKRIWSEHALIKELLARGLTADDIKKYHLGVERKRITIPIYDDRGFCINLRKYLPGAPGDKKFQDERGCGKNVHLYPVDQLGFPQLVISGGEVKAISAAKFLNPLGIGSVSATGGEGRWATELSEQLNNKEKVWLAYDIDAKGQSAAQQIARNLCTYVEWLGIIDLPLDIEAFPHGGLDDFLVQGGNIQSLLESCEEYVPIKLLERDYDADPIKKFSSLTAVISSDHVGGRVSSDCVISTLDTMPYPLPKQLRITCPKNIDWCQLCSMYPVRPEDMVLDIHPENPAVLGMIDVGEEKLFERQKQACSIPANCKVCKFEILKFQHAEDTRISEHLEVTKRTDDKSMVPAIIVSDDVKPNTPYTFTARLYPHPVTNASVLLVSDLKRKEDSLDTFDVTKTTHLEMFQPAEWTAESIGVKLDEVYTDLEANVTRIYQRRQMHLMMDLAYHSPLFLTDIFGKTKEKGWVEILVIGDSSQGKTEAANCLLEHYGIGGWLSCKAATYAGVVGGVQQINKKWFITWGAMPLQDRRLLVFEEMKGLDPEILTQLTDVRSSGIAQITKIERQQTYARCRMIGLSNPRSDRSIGTYNSGVDVIKELVGHLEDVRRFDSFYIAKKEDVDEAVIGQKVSAEHLYTADYCRDLVLWAWTIPKTVFEDQAHILAKSQEFGRIYTDDVPIYDRGGGRFKIARLAAALACRTYSCTPDRKAVYVRKAHVEYICNFLHALYSSDAFGYKEFSAQRREMETLVDEDVLLKDLNSLPTPRFTANSLLQSNDITLESLMIVLQWGKDETSSFFSQLLRSHCIRRGKGQTYFKTPAFVRFLKEALANHEIVDRPEYIEKSEM